MVEDDKVDEEADRVVQELGDQGVIGSWRFEETH